MNTSIHKNQLKSDRVDGSIGNRMREVKLFSFNCFSPQEYKSIQKPTTVLYKNENKTRLDRIHVFFEDSYLSQKIPTMNLQHSQIKSSRYTQ